MRFAPSAVLIITTCTQIRYPLFRMIVKAACVRRWSNISARWQRMSHSPSSWPTFLACSFTGASLRLSNGDVSLRRAFLGS